MLQLDANFIRLSFQQPGGQLFTAFVDDLIRTHAVLLKIPDSAVEANVRTNIPDGGVDTLVRLPASGDTTGRFDVPTVWQYKASAIGNVEPARDLVKGDYVRECIRQGFGFRLVVADGLTSERRAQRIGPLRQVCLEINPAAPEPLIVSADDLAAWANQYLGLVLKWLAPDLGGALLHMDAWALNVLEATRTFVPVREWENILAQLQEHIDLGRESPSVLRTVQGEAGVGKTRLVYQVVAAVPGMKGLVLYCDDEHMASEVARRVANLGNAQAILIADDCGPEGREQLRRVLEGHRNRARIIGIDNSGRRPASGDPELWIEKMSDATMEQVLEANYRHIPAERRRAYADLARGYPRLAVDLCRYDVEIVARGGDVAPAIPSVRDYLHIRLNSEQRLAFEALSLVTKIGYQGDVQAEFPLLCGVVRVEPEGALQWLLEIHRGSGFIARAGRYLYVTPEIVAHTGFGEAWHRWAAADPEGFLARIPDALLACFLDRVQRSGSREVRRICGDYFRGWAAELRPEHLIDETTTSRLVTLIEVAPGEYLPRLRRIIEEGSQGTLRGITGRPVKGRWGARRALVWLAERLVRFPEFFSDCERILARLAWAEAEPDIANNATGIWGQLFRVYLSGTAVPFQERLLRLRERLRGDNNELRALSLKALEGLFSTNAHRMEGQPVVAGRIPPQEWWPQTGREAFECFKGAVGLLDEAIGCGNPELSQEIVKFLCRHTRWFILNGLFKEVQDVLSRVSLNDEDRIRLVDSLDEFLIYDVPRSIPELSNLETSVRACRDSLIGTDIHSQVLAIVGAPRWGAVRLQDSGWQASLERLAEELIRVRDMLRQELEWLFSDRAHGAGELGFELGRRDSQGELAEEILGYALRKEQRAFAYGYIRGLLKNNPSHATMVNRWLDENEDAAPEVVADLAIAAGKAARAFERVLQLFDRGLLAAGFLLEPNFRSEGKPIPPDRFEQLVARLARAAADGDRNAMRVGLENLALRLLGNKDEESLLERVAVRDAAWMLLERSIEDQELISHWWGEIVIRLGEVNALRAARIACRTLISGQIWIHRDAEEVIVKLASRFPSEMMDALGEIALDQEHGWKFFVSNFRGIIGSLSGEVVQAWIMRAGVEGARRLARHLPVPHLEGDKGVVPPLTEWVLSRFSDDERVFKEFCAGVHSFEVYSGDIAAQHEAEAAVARAFHGHPLPRIRQWAQFEERWALGDAKEEREREAEFGLL